MRVVESVVVVQTPHGPMQCALWAPVGAAGSRFPGLVFWSEIFQLTGPIRRTCALLAGHGFLVLAPEVYHDQLPPGTVLTYTPEDTARGNACKTARPLAAYDGDAAAAVAALRALAACTGAVGTAGTCLGGGLAFRCAVTTGTPAVCFYATDLHKGKPAGGGIASDGDDTLERVRGGALRGGAELLMVYGRADPHIPLEGRRVVQDALEAGGASYSWHEFSDAAHAFLRDENSGGRYDPELARTCYGLAIDWLRMRLAGGAAPAALAATPAAPSAPS